jgi:arylsulfatase A-like enzyme
VDQSLGDILDHLDDLAVAQDTLVLFLGDNGTDAPLGHQHEVACAAPLRGKKGSHYEGGMRVPFVAAWARPDPESPHQQRLPLAAGTIQPGIASVTDLFPTLLRLAGAEIPAGHPVDGAPLDGLLAGRPDKAREESFLMHYPHAPHRTDYWTSYREGDWKVIHHYIPTVVSRGSRYQLFHLGEDPYEQSDRAAANPEVLRRMMQRLAAKLEAYGAAYPVAPDGQPLKPVVP